MTDTGLATMFWQTEAHTGSNEIPENEKCAMHEAEYLTRIRLPAPGRTGAQETPSMLVSISQACTSVTTLKLSFIKPAFLVSVSSVEQ